ncbi:tetratricopeptide repeat protein [Methylocella tundrae]|nr:tetratricopeptide repeat protein [Methylocella tundrae]
MSRANAEGVNGAGGQRAAAPGVQQLSPMEDWLQRALADLSSRGADGDAPIDLSQSLAAMAAILNEIVQSRPIPAASEQGAGAETGVRKTRRAADAPSPDSPTSADRKHKSQTLSAGAEGRSAEVFASPDADGGESLTELTRRLDEIEQRLRAGGGHDDDQSLTGALTEIEARLRKAAARRAELAKSSPSPDQQTLEKMDAPHPLAPAGSAAAGEKPVPASLAAGPRRIAETPALSPVERLPDLEASIRDLTALMRALGERRAGADLRAARRGGWPGEQFNRPLQEPPPSGEQAAAPVAGPRPDGAVSTPMPRPAATRRAAAADAAVSHSAIEMIEAQLRALTRKVEEAIARSCDSGPYDTLTERVAAAEKRLTEKLESGLAAAASETDSLKDIVQSLAGKIEAARQPGASDLSIQSLDREIGAIAERLDGADKGLSSLARLEQSISRLFEQMEEIREIASNAAARDADREGALPADLDRRAEGGGHDRRLTREIADLRATRDEADKRIHLALNAVQETVAKVADRLAVMEADLGEMRPAADRLLPLLTPRAERRLRGDQEGDFFSTETLQRRPLSGAPGPVLVSTKESVTHSLFSRDAAQTADGTAANGQKDVEPADLLIEPGSGSPRRREAPEHRASGEPPQPEREAGGGGRADFIAAARRAAQAAQFEADGSLKGQAPAGDHAGASGGFFSAHRRPILLAIAALCLALGAYTIARNGSLKSLGPTSFLNAIGKGAASSALRPQRGGNLAGGPPTLAAPGATSAAVKPAKAAPPSAAAMKREPIAPQNNVKANAALRDSRLFDPAPLNVLSPLRQAPPPAENPPSHGAPFMHAIAGSDPIIVGAIAGHAGVIHSAPAPIAAAPQPLAGAPTVIASLPGMPLEQLRAKAEAGDAPAQFELGLRFADGRAGSQDMALAAQYYAKAADQGLALAQYRLAVLSEKGVGGGRDLARAQSLYLAAAEQGNARAMHNLGVLAAEGVDGEPDYAKAAAWFEKAAAFGIRDSQFNLAVLLARGSSLSHDAARSYTWFSIAAATGDQEAARKRDEMALKLSPADLAAATAAASTFRPRTLDPAVNEISVSGNPAIASAPAALPTQRKASNL